MLGLSFSSFAMYPFWLLQVEFKLLFSTPFLFLFGLQFKNESYLYGALWTSLSGEPCHYLQWAWEEVFNTQHIIFFFSLKCLMYSRQDVPVRGAKRDSCPKGSDGGKRRSVKHTLLVCCPGRWGARVVPVRPWAWLGATSSRPFPRITPWCQLSA